MSSTSPERKSSIIKACTAGEELFLVHLQRERVEDVSDDADQCRKRDRRTIGEELWDIHRKRSRGGQDDDKDEANVDDGHSSDNSTNEDVRKKDPEDFGDKSNGATQKCPYNLRSKDRGKKM